MTTIPPEAIKAATQAAKRALHKAQCETYLDVGTCSIPLHFEDWAYAGEEAVDAALPHIEAAIADRLETWAAEHKRSGNPEHDNALSMAASLIRGRVANWPGTGDPR